MIIIIITIILLIITTMITIIIIITDNSNHNNNNNSVSMISRIDEKCIPKKQPFKLKHPFSKKTQNTSV